MQVPAGVTVQRPTGSKLPKRPLLPPKPLKLKTSTGQSKRMAFTARNDITKQGQSPLPRAENGIKTTSMENSQCFELPPRVNEQANRLQMVSVSKVVEVATAAASESEDKKIEQDNRPPPVPPRRISLLKSRQMQTDHTYTQ